MAVLDAKICSNCKRLVPDDCDGRTYQVADWRRLACKGSDDGRFRQATDGTMKFDLVMGHGNTITYDAVEVE